VCGHVKPWKRSSASLDCIRSQIPLDLTALPRRCRLAHLRALLGPRGVTSEAGKRSASKVSFKVTYTVAASAVSNNMRSAGTNYKFNTASKLTYSGGKISGSWSETTYDASGSVSGTATGNTVHARISGDKFSGRMSINVSGSRHTINIVQLDKKSGSYRQAASVSLHR